MKHRAAPKVSPYNDTKRKRLALLRKQDRERQALPLFAPLIAETQPDPEAVMQGYAKSWEQRQVVQREQRAAAWRAARRRLFAFPHPQRGQIRRSWSASP